MNPERFQNSPAGHLVQKGQGEAAYWAFVRNRSRRNLPFDAGLVRACSAAPGPGPWGNWRGSAGPCPIPSCSIAPFIRREAVLSSRIEGTQTDLTDLYAYEAGQLPLFAGLKTVRPSPTLRK